VYSHIYFGRTVEELDAIDATVANTGVAELKAEDADQLWRDLADEDASRSL
jgi:hypothetical protein